MRAEAPGDDRSRAVGEEVEDAERGDEHRARDAQPGERPGPQVADNRGVGEHVERFGREREEGRDREPQDLAIASPVVGSRGRGHRRKSYHSARRRRPGVRVLVGSRVVHDELGFYVLAGQPATSRDLLAEVRDGERMGFGTAFISERYNKKEAAALSGAAGAVSERIRIETAATNHNTRHPMVTAGFARTMQSLTGGRFVLGIGRGITLLQDAFGQGRITTAQMEDFAGLMRRLFRGEVIIGHDGPAGKFPVLHLDATLDEYLPMSIVAFGPNSLALGGRCFDDVVLHTYFTDETTARCVADGQEGSRTGRS